MDALRELGFTLWDALCCGDLPGHLRVWRRVVRGEVDGETRVALTAAVVADAGAPAAPTPATVQSALRSEPVLNRARSAEGAVRGQA